MFLMLAFPVTNAFLISLLLRLQLFFLPLVRILLLLLHGPTRLG